MDRFISFKSHGVQFQYAQNIMKHNNKLTEITNELVITDIIVNDNEIVIVN